MCGITGYYSLKNKITLEKYYNAHKLLSHRGPDDEGFVAINNNKITEYKGEDTINEYSDYNDILELEKSNLVLGHRRLSIIDLSKNGHQPFIFKNLSLVFNGEIFNYLELKKDLLKAGYFFETNSDTEVFLKAFHFYGFEAFNKFNGMWAAAIYDKSKKNLVLTRDRFGVKPLYYSLINENLYFGSEVKFILPFHDKIESNFEMVYDFIEHNKIWHSHETMFKNISQLNPGSILSFNGSKIIFNEYYNIKGKKNQSSLGVKKLFNDSVKLRLRSDVQVGTMLSGGIDSTLITSQAKKIKSDLQSFSITFDENESDPEINYIKKTSKKLDLNSNYINIQYDSYSPEELIETIEFPFRSFTVPSQRKLFEFVKNNSDVKVLLSGEGADEVFSGYNIHPYIFIISLLKNLKIKKAFFEIYSLKNLKKISLIKLVLKLFKDYLFVSKNKSIIFIKNIINNKSSHFNKKRKYPIPIKYSNDFFEDFLYRSLNESALKEYLMYSDLNSMKYSIEVRVPFMDYRLIEKGYSINKNKKVIRGIPKQPLRKYFNGEVSREILDRKDKKGFYTPYEKWMKNDLIPELDEYFYNLKEDEKFNYFDYKKLFNSYEKFKKEKGKKDYTYFWRVFLLHKWKKVWKIEK